MELKRKICILFIVYSSDKSLLKALYLSTMEATKKWSQPLRNWGKVHGEFSIMYEGRFKD